jgi:serine/threonine-protein kinase
MRRLLWLLLAVAVGVASGYATFRLATMGRVVEVPDLTGQSPEEARALLKELGLRLRIERYSYDPLLPKGHISQQSPPAGEFARYGRVVQVVVSRGPKALRMPSVLGLTLAEAAVGLAKEGLSISKVIKVHSPLPRGTVLAQSPEPDEPTGAPITVVVSQGPFEVSYFCPDFTALSTEEALQLAQALGLKAEVEFFGPRVLAQKPQPGREVKEGEEVVLLLGYE